MYAFDKPDFKYRPELHRLLRKKALASRKGEGALRSGGSQRRMGLGSSQNRTRVDNQQSGSR
jgi:hypothetical protein